MFLLLFRLVLSVNLIVGRGDCRTFTVEDAYTEPVYFAPPSPSFATYSYWFVAYDLEEGDILKYTLRKQFTEDLDNQYWITATYDEMCKIIHSGVQFTVVVQTKTHRPITVRIGYTYFKFQQTIVTTQTDFDPAELAAKYGISDTPDSLEILLIPKYAQVSFKQYTTGPTTSLRVFDTTSFSLGWDPYGNETYTVDNLPIQLVFTKATLSQWPVHLTSVDRGNLVDDSYWDIYDKNNLPRTPLPTPERTPDKTPERTPDKTPERTPDKTPDSTPMKTPDRTPYSTPMKTPSSTPMKTPDRTPMKTPYRTPYSTPMKTPDRMPSQEPSPEKTRSSSSSSLESSSSSPNSSSSEYIYSRTIAATPGPTWDGAWANPPNIIIRGDDIPEIAETHPPLQTQYIKSEVPKVKAAVTISTGTVIVIVTIVLTVLNIIRSYKKMKTIIHPDEFEDNEVEEFSFESSYTMSTNTDGDESPFVLD